MQEWANRRLYNIIKKDVYLWIYQDHEDVYDEEDWIGGGTDDQLHAGIPTGLGLLVVFQVDVRFHGVHELVDVVLLVIRFGPVQDLVRVERIAVEIRLGERCLRLHDYGQFLYSDRTVIPSLWLSGIGSRLGRNRLWVRFLTVLSDKYPMFIEPTITWVTSGFSGYIMAWPQKIVLKQIRGFLKKQTHSADQPSISS